MGRADWVPDDIMKHILAALMPENSLALRVSMYTGLRIDDVLSITRKQLEKGQRFTIHEQKTGKARRVYLSKGLYDELLKNAGRYYAFPSRLDERKHRTRQAVHKDTRRAAAAFRVPDAVQISPHSARKIYAVQMMNQYGDPKKVQQLLNHSNEAVTMVYCMAEAIYNKKMQKRPRKRK